MKNQSLKSTYLPPCVRTDSMKKASISHVESNVVGEDSASRSLSEPLGATNIALNHYRLAPGEGFPGGLHAHMDQEEIFVVLEGEATFETLDGEVTVGEREAIRFAPGEFQSGKNNSNSELTVVALGAPRGTDNIQIPVMCPNCEHDTLRLQRRDDELTFVCPNCDAEHIPQNCPECSHSDLRVTLDETVHVVVVCQNCDAEFENPPLQSQVD